MQDVRDPVGVTGWPLDRGRDGERTPMQWNSSANAGFTLEGVDPRLPLPQAAWQHRTVEAESKEPCSLLSLYRQLLALRRSHCTLREGDCRMHAHDEEGALVWSRSPPAVEEVGSGDGGPRPASCVFALCNITCEARTISVCRDVKAIGRAGSALRPLLQPQTPSVPATFTVSTDEILLEAYGLFLGELLG